ncbi:MAG: hypothetical protein IKI99_02480, partial [Firmicutes bacterium]|nr:hypothetical protein [Bacillota bacterium]
MKIKNRNCSRVAALLMVFIMVFTMIPPMAFAGTSENVPFTATVNGETMTDVTESTLTWTDMYTSVSRDVTCYNVTVPEGATEATLNFQEEKQWSYYDSQGAYVGAGDTSWTSSIEHTVAITDSNSDGELDGISVQIPDAYSTEFYILFKYAEAKAETPFLSVKIGNEAVVSENIAYKGIFSLGDYDVEESDGYDYVHEVPYYHVTVPCGTESVDVTYPANADIMNYGSDAYGYKTDIEGIDAMTSATVKGTTFKNAYAKNADGTQTVTTPVKGYAFDTDGNGHAITLEGAAAPYAALCLFSFIYDGVNHVYVDGVCSCGAEEPIEVEIPEGLNLERISPVTAIEDGEEITFTLWGMESSAPGYIATVPEGTETVELTFKAGTHPEPYSNKISGAMLTYNEEDESYSASGTESSASQGEDGLYTITLNAGDMIRNGKYYGAYDASYNTQYVLRFKYPEGAHEHTYDDGVITTKPSCNEPGVKTFTCTGCSEGTEGHSYTEAVPATGHSYDAGKITTAATCAAAGVKTFTCGNCSEGTEGHTYTEAVPATGHSYDEGVVTTNPTCTEAGVKTFTCQTEGCTAETTGHTKTATVEKLGHDYNNEERKCPRCGDVAPAQDENGVYQLGTAEELLWFANKVNSGETTSAKAALIADIELDAEWPGIGAYGKAFAGSFDGQNHKVTLNNSTWGVFGYVMGTHNNHALKDAAVIENIIVEGTVKNSALIHTAGYARITNCINKAEITSENSKVAGIVGSVSGSNKYGQIYSDVMIQNCANEGNIKGDNDVGGILGYSQAKATLAGCYNTGSVGGSSNVGGLVGYMQGSSGKGVIQNSYNKGAVTGTSCVAGIVGNMYNGVSIANCYNAGEATYAIAGNIYNNTASITNTYYRGNLCTYSVPNVTQNAGFYTGNRGVAKTSAEMSSEELAALLGDTFKQSCPSPVLSYQEASDHVIENNVCQICKQGNDMPEEFAVTFAAATGSEIVGDTTFRKGNSYTFSVNVLAGYYATADFAVYVNGTKVEAVDGVYTVSEPDGPFYISTSGVKEEEGVLPIVLPGTGEGYRVNPCDGYGATVERGNDYKFTVSFVEGFAAGEDFMVKANGLIVKADENGVYTLENITLQQDITVEGVDVVPSGNTVAVKIDFTKGDYLFLAS